MRRKFGSSGSMALRMYNGRALGSQKRSRWRRRTKPTFTIARLDGVALPKPKARRVVGWAMVVGLVAALSTGIPDAYSGLQGSDLFTVRKISVVGHQLMTAEEIVDRAGLEVGSNLFQTDLTTATDSLRAHPLVRRVLLLRRPPADLLISVEERSPISLITTMDGLIGLDRDARCFPLPTVPFDLPVVTSFAAATADSVEAEDSAAAHRLVAFLLEIRDKYPSVWSTLSEVNVLSPTEARIHLIDGTPELLVRYDRSGAQIENLKAFVASSPNLSTLAYIDLRYENQVVAGRIGVDASDVSTAPLPAF